MSKNKLDIESTVSGRAAPSRRELVLGFLAGIALAVAVAALVVASVNTAKDTTAAASNSASSSSVSEGDTPGTQLDSTRYCFDSRATEYLCTGPFACAFALGSATVNVEEKTMCLDFHSHHDHCGLTYIRLLGPRNVSNDNFLNSIPIIAEFSNATYYNLTSAEAKVCAGIPSPAELVKRPWKFELFFSFGYNDECGTLLFVPRVPPYLSAPFTGKC